MDNKLFNNIGKLLLSGALVFGAAGCKDYDGDISNLQSQIDAINVSIGDLQNKIAQGDIVKSIQPTADGGVVITMSTGESYTVGKTGQPGNTWTIGSDGYWYENGKKTDYRALGQDGQDGKDGQNGTNGKDGKDGEKGDQGDSVYYVPNVTTGCFDKYVNGKKVESTDISWRAVGVTAVYTGTKLTLSGVDGATNGVVEINLGEAVGSLEFIPAVMSGAFPTTDVQFLVVKNYLDENQYTTSGNKKLFKTLTSLNKSNPVAFEYRVNPSNAYVYEYAQAAFVNRGLTSRAADDNGNLLNVVTSKDNDGNVKYVNVKNGEMTVVATLNGNNVMGGKTNVAAVKLYNGQDFTVSDYTTLDPQAIDVVLVDSAKGKAAQPKYFYDRTEALPNAAEETDAFVKHFVTLNDAANAELIYNGQLDLANLPGLWTTTKKAYLTDPAVNITGMSYKFSLPKSFVADDTQKTDQQWFVELVDGHILKANAKNLTNGLTPAIGRKPVVRVDAFLADNAGVERLVASAYILVDIVREPTVEEEDQKDIEVYMPAQFKKYHDLTDAWTQINFLGWKDVNNKIYGVTGLNSEDFWKYYGHGQNLYSATLSVNDKGKPKEIVKQNVADNQISFTAEGVKCLATLDDKSVTTSFVEVAINNQIKTQNSYGDVDGKGAEYTLEITIESDNIKALGNVKVIQKFYVSETCEWYKYSGEYYIPSRDALQVKGLVDNNVWTLKMGIAEAFVPINGKNIFQYATDKDIQPVSNVTNLEFFLLNNQGKPAANNEYNGIKYDSNKREIYLTAPIKGTENVATMQYTETLVNTERCNKKFNVIFENPFKGTTASKTVLLYGNNPGTQNAQVVDQVKVVDLINEPILEWDGTKLALTPRGGGNLYHLQMSDISIKYAFGNDADQFLKQLISDDMLKIDANTGVVTWDNYGADLQNDHDMTIEVTVTIDTISVVTCKIPFKLLAQKSSNN